MKVSCVKKVIDNCPVPPIVDPLGKSWNQPNPHNFVWDEDCVAMSEQDYKSLHTYDCTLPTGIYEGKMWKTHIRKNGEEVPYLCYITDDPVNAEYCIINRIIILIVK